MEKERLVASSASAPVWQTVVYMPRATQMAALETSGSLHRRGVASTGADEDGPDGALRHTLAGDVGHAASDAVLVTTLALVLLRYLGLGYKWLVKLSALLLYAALLLPGFLQVGWYYLTSKRVQRSVVYGDKPRNRLDLYLPEKRVGGAKPVVVFVTGGAWVIGYKAWGALLGQTLEERGIIVACLDYRNFPQGQVSDMVEDVGAGIAWVLGNIGSYGGDPSRVYLVGQSAGAHLSAMAVLGQAQLCAGGGAVPAWLPSQLRAFIGVSGGYDLVELVEYFHTRGLYKSIMLKVMQGPEFLPRFSPQLVVASPEFAGAAQHLPPITLLHGTADYSIPWEASTKFAEALSAAGVAVNTKLYDGKTHTDPIIQDPMRGGTDPLVEDIINIIRTHDDPNGTQVPLNSRPRPRMVPEFLLKAARSVSPF